ncbi:MAG TPA: hypothetical protein VIQ23_06530 [Hanamia sp.]
MMNSKNASNAPNIVVKRKGVSLYLCILLDLIGLTSYLLPVIGETIDMVWAPMSGIIFYFLFGMKKFGLLGGFFSFLEELAPGLDFIPTFTIAWFIRKREEDKNTSNIQTLL